MSPARRPKVRDEAAEAARFVEEIKETADKLLRDGADRGEIKLLSRTLRELRYAFQVLASYQGRRKVTVFGSSRTTPEARLYKHAVAFGKAIADRDFMVITGAGPGIMEACHVGARTERSIGLNILLPFEQRANKVIAEDEKLINLNFFFTRKLLFLKESDALVLFPGGFGTLDESFEILTMLQTGKSVMMPIVMIDEPGGQYWATWADYVKNCLLGQGMISEEDLSLYKITASIGEAVDEIVNFYRVYHSERYIWHWLALRLKRSLSTATMRRINAEFSDILASGRFRQTKAHPYEANEPELADLPRLVFHFDRKSHGRLRELINLINQEP